MSIGPRYPSKFLRFSITSESTGEVAVTGRIAPPPSRLFAFGDSELGRIRQNVDLEALEEDHNAEDNDIITLTGIVGQVSEESKVVHGATRVLTTIHMVDATGKFMVRTWNHVHQQFQAFVDKPVSIQRVRVVSFAGEKLAEFLDGNGSVILTDFPGCSSLKDWWISA